MASSMGKSVLGKGSDFYDEDSCNCQSCLVQGKGDIPANRFCVDCQEFMCGNCSACHNALKAAKKHVLVTAEEAKKKTPPKVTKDKCSLKCAAHKDKTVKHFCVTHAYLGCSVCITMNHKQCLAVEYIPTVAEGIRNHYGFKTFDKTLKALETACKTGLSDVEKNLKTIEADERQMKEAIQHFRKQLNDALDSYEKEFTVAAGTMRHEETTKLNALSKELAKSVANIDTLVEKVTSLLSSGKNCDTYVIMKKEANQLVSLKKDLTKAVQGTSYQRYEFQPNKDVLKTATLGKLRIRPETVIFSTAVTALAPINKDGPSMVKLLKQGTRVRRGQDWNRRNEDGGGFGTIVGPSKAFGGWYIVKWDQGYEDHYRMGAHNAYDLDTV